MFPDRDDGDGDAAAARRHPVPGHDCCTHPDLHRHGPVLGHAALVTTDTRTVHRQAARPAADQLKRTSTAPSPRKSARTVLPAATGTARVQDPGRTRCPASRATPRSPSVLASHATAAAG